MLTMTQTARKTQEQSRIRTNPLPVVASDERKWRTLGECAHRFSVTEYALLAEAGILHEDDRIELIEGRIEDMAPIGSSHASSVKRLLKTFVTRFQSQATVGVQDPVQLNAFSEPQPDVMLLRPRDDFYAERHPAPEDVLLLIEVADSSVEYDQQVKIPLYAKSGIQEVWLFNLRDQCVEVYRSPVGESYETILILRGQQEVTPLAFPEVSLTIADLLGRTTK